MEPAVREKPCFVIFRLSKLLACQLWEIPSDFLDVCPCHARVCVN